MNRSRYLMIAVLAVFIFFLFYSGADNSKTAQDVFQSMEQTVKRGSLEEMTKRELMQYYGISSADVSSFVLYGSTSSMDAAEVLVIKAKDSDQLSDLREAVEARRQEQISKFSGYDEDQVALLENGYIESRGNFLLYAVGADAAELDADFRTGVR